MSQNMTCVIGAGSYLGDKAHSISCLVLANMGTAPACIDSELYVYTCVDVMGACDIITRIVALNGQDKATIAEYSTLVPVGSGTDNRPAESLVQEALTTDGSVGLPAPSTQLVGTQEQLVSKKPTCTKCETEACDGDKAVIPSLYNGPKALPITDPDYLAPEQQKQIIMADPLMILPAKEALCVCIPGPTCDSEPSCLQNSVSGGSSDNVTAADDHCTSNDEGSCHDDEPAKYKASDVTGDSHQSGYSSTGEPCGHKLGYGSNNSSRCVSSENVDSHETAIPDNVEVTLTLHVLLVSVARL